MAQKDAFSYLVNDRVEADRRLDIKERPCESWRVWYALAGDGGTLGRHRKRHLVLARRNAMKDCDPK